MKIMSIINPLNQKIYQDIMKFLAELEESVHL
jgi:hypothetical protein